MKDRPLEVPPPETSPTAVSPWNTAPPESPWSLVTQLPKPYTYRPLTVAQPPTLATVPVWYPVVRPERAIDPVWTVPTLRMGKEDAARSLDAAVLQSVTRGRMVLLGFDTVYTETSVAFGSDSRATVLPVPPNCEKASVPNDPSEDTPPPAVPPPAGSRVGSAALALVSTPSFEQ